MEISIQTCNGTYSSNIYLTGLTAGLCFTWTNAVTTGLDPLEATSAIWQHFSK